MLENQVRCWSLWQPYAGGCVRGEKRIETRGRNINVRGTVYIHAAQSHIAPKSAYREINAALGNPARNVYNNPYKFSEGQTGAFGAIVGSVEIVNCVPIEQLYGTEYDTPLERAYGDWTPGRYGIILENPKSLKKAIPAKGHQGFWFAEKSLVEEEQT